MYRFIKDKRLILTATKEGFNDASTRQRAEQAAMYNDFSNGLNIHDTSGRKGSDKTRHYVGGSLRNASRPYMERMETHNDVKLDPEQIQKAIDKPVLGGSIHVGESVSPTMIRGFDMVGIDGASVQPSDMIYKPGVNMNTVLHDQIDTSMLPANEESGVIPDPVGRNGNLHLNKRTLGVAGVGNGHRLSVNKSTPENGGAPGANRRHRRTE